MLCVYSIVIKLVAKQARAKRLGCGYLGISNLAHSTAQGEKQLKGGQDSYRRKKGKINAQGYLIPEVCSLHKDTRENN